MLRSLPRPSRLRAERNYGYMANKPYSEEKLNKLRENPYRKVRENEQYGNRRNEGIH